MNASHLQQLAVLNPSQGQIHGLAWSPDGTLVAATYESGTVRVWQKQTQKQLAVLHGHSGEVWTLGWSPDGTSLATGGDDATLRLWGLR